MRKGAFLLMVTILFALSCLGVRDAFGGYSNTIRLAIGARAAGMGGAYCAIADDGNALFYNPGGMGFVDGSVVNVDGGLILAHPTYKDPENSERDGNEVGSGIGAFPDFGVVQQLGESPIRFGLSSNTYSAIRMKYDINSTLLVASGSEKSSFDFNLFQERITPGLAVQVTDNVSVGAGYVIAYQRFSQVTPYQFQSSVKPATLDGVNYISDFETDGFGQGGIFGVLFKIGDKTHVGASYTTSMRVKLKGRDEVTLRNNPGLVGYGINDGDRNNYDIAMKWRWPQVFGTGISHQLTDKVLLAFDWQWFDWSNDDKLELILSNGNNATVNAVVGGNGNIRDAFRHDQNDAYVYHFGIEYMATENVALRGGYIFSTNPVPDNTLTPLFPGNFQHTTSLGIGTHYAGWEIDAAWSHTFPNEQDVGTSAIEGGEYTNSETANQNDIFFLSFGKPF